MKRNVEPLPPEHPLHAATTAARIEAHHRANMEATSGRIDKMLSRLMPAQWVFAVVVALVYSPYTSAGRTASTHMHVVLAVVGGAFLTIPVVLLAHFRPTETATRHFIAVTQMLWSALLIHLTGGQLETHFHIFCSLAFLAFYRDWRVLVTASAVVLADHVGRTLFLPVSLYGVTGVGWWRLFEHVFWVAFEDAILMIGVHQALREQRGLAVKQTAMEDLHANIESTVRERTRELENSIAHQRSMEKELAQAHKLEAVGRIASGIAHEINTPVQFVNDNIYFVRESLESSLALLAKYREARITAAAGAVPPSVWEEIASTEEAIELDYLIANVPKALASSVEGLTRVTTLVASMKEFAHPDRVDKANACINHAIKTTLVIAKNEYKYVADVTTDLGELPPVSCHINQLNQVFLNIIVNAAHAIADKVAGTGKRGIINISTYLDGGDVVVAIRDTGGGIPEAVRDRIFDPFFTTKEIGKGTGQGLAIARSVVVDKHGGRLRFTTEIGRGTTFFIRLPVQAEQKAAA